ncbi:hypothetical protein NEIRO03_0061 [Nematocida sp. AWRm78]|nr:hypothetical protein NEIRO02_0124 [Nematocida sp. AWRm79]KAI5182377.1 hypothetical protein NEIRO03_0061 [Nematocida sp. AWRm78]
MKQLRKKPIIFELLCLCIQTVICPRFKATPKQDILQSNYSPYNSAHPSKNNSSIIKTSNKIKEMPLMRTMWWDRVNGAISDINSQNMQIHCQPLNVSNSLKRPRSIDSNTASYSNIKKVCYMDADVIEDNNIDTPKTVDIIPETTIHLTTGMPPSTTINPLKINPTDKTVITRALYSCKPKNKYIIRNYTSCIESVENIIFSHSRNHLKPIELAKKEKAIIKSWKNDTETDIWTMIKSMDIDFLLLKRIFKKMIATELRGLCTLPNPLYYDGFIHDIAVYNNDYGPILRNYKLLRYINRKNETLGDIWINKEVSLYCCCSGIDRQMDIEGTEEDIRLKKILNFILLIPEVYEDFYKMPESVINEFFNELKLPSNNIATPESESNIEKNLSFIKHIIIYLRHTAQNNKALANMSYRKIKQIRTYEYNNKFIKDLDAIEVYTLIYNSARLFYKYHGIAYKLTKYQKHKINCRTILMHIMGAYTIQSYTQMLGPTSVMHSNYFKSTVSIKNIDKIENSGFICSIDIDNLDYTHVFSENSPLLSIKDHYHVQFVDNEWHTVTMVHIPYYIHRQKNGTILNYPFHNIKNIVKYLKRAFIIGDNQKAGKIRSVYPFKYNRKDKT